MDLLRNKNNSMNHPQYPLLSGALISLLAKCLVATVKENHLETSFPRSGKGQGKQ